MNCQANLLKAISFKSYLTKPYGTKKMHTSALGAVHKRRHQSRGRGVPKRWSYLISLFSKSDYEGGQKSQKIDDVFYEWPSKT